MSKDIKIHQAKIEHSRIKAILFDVDGTLSDTDDHMVMRISRVLKPVSFLFLNRDPARFARWIVMAIETPSNFIYGVADRLGLDAPISKLVSRFSEGRHEKAGYAQYFIIPGVQEMLDKLFEHYPLGIVSARDEASTLRFLDHFDLAPYFKTIVSAQTCKYTKPFPDPVIFAAQQLGVMPEECLMIGDTVVDVRAGNSAGAKTVAVLCGFGTRRELERAGADLILPFTPDITDILLDGRRAAGTTPDEKNE